MKRRKLNRKNLPKWTRCLSAKQIWHLKEDVCNPLVLRIVKRNFAGQAEMAKEPIHFPCWDCRSIEQTLKKAGVIS